MSRRRPAKHAARGRRMVGWRPDFNGGPDVDVAAAVELVIAGLDERPVAPQVNLRRAYQVIAGFVVLTAELLEELHGVDLDAARAHLVAVQLREHADDLAAGVAAVDLSTAMSGGTATGPP